MPGMFSNISPYLVCVGCHLIGQNHIVVLFSNAKLGKVGVYYHIEIVVFPVNLMELMVCFLIGVVSYPCLTGNSLKPIMKLTTFLG